MARPYVKNRSIVNEVRLTFKAPRWMKTGIESTCAAQKLTLSDYIRGLVRVDLEKTMKQGEMTDDQSTASPGPVVGN